MIQLAKAFRHDSGPHALAARRLCDELQQAVNTLCDGPKKEAYDAELRLQRGGLPPQTDLPADTVGPQSSAPSTITPPLPPWIPVKPLLAASCALGLAWAAFTLWNLAGGTEPPPPTRLVQQGVIDMTLPPAQREKQAALKDILDHLEQGMPYSKLKEFTPGVRLTESAHDFYRDVIGLERWEFNGKPQSDDVTVVPCMSLDKPGNPEQRIDRVYTVKGSGGQFVISRKK
jgi:hypothetical protein